MKHGWNLKLWLRVVDVWDPMESFSAGWLAVSTATVGGCDRFQWCGALSRARPQEFTEDFDIWDGCMETYWNTVASVLLPFVANRCQQHWLMDTTHALVKSSFYWVGLLLFPMPFFLVPFASVCFRSGDKTTLHFAWCAYLWLCGWTPVVLILATWWFVTQPASFGRFWSDVLRPNFTFCWKKLGLWCLEASLGS